MKTSVKLPHIARIMLAAALPPQMLWPAVGCPALELQAPMAVPAVTGRGDSKGKGRRARSKNAAAAGKPK